MAAKMAAIQLQLPDGTLHRFDVTGSWSSILQRVRLLCGIPRDQGFHLESCDPSESGCYVARATEDVGSGGTFIVRMDEGDANGNASDVWNPCPCPQRRPTWRVVLGLFVAPLLIGGVAAAVVAAGALEWAAGARCPVPMLEYLVGSGAMILVFAVNVVVFQRRSAVITANVLAYFLLFCVLAFGWAVAGSVWLASGAAACMDSMPLAYGLGIASVVILLPGVTVLTVFAIVASLSHLVPEDESPPVLVVLRCSCCALAAKKLVCGVAPFLALAGVAVALVVQNWELRCSQPLHEFVLVSAAIFLAYACAAGVILFSPVRYSRATFVLIVLLTVADLAWAATGVVWVVRGTPDCVDVVPHLYYAAISLKAMMFVLGTVSVCCTALFRPERFLDGRPPLPIHFTEQVRETLRGHGAKGGRNDPSLLGAETGGGETA
jgi:hypothetical protein